MDRHRTISGPGCFRRGGKVQQIRRAPDAPVFTVIDRCAEMLPAIRAAKFRMTHRYGEDCQ
jgi:hypothetical protein